MFGKSIDLFKLLVLRSPDNTIDLQADAMEALAPMSRTDSSRFMVTGRIAWWALSASRSELHRIVANIAVHME